MKTAANIMIWTFFLTLTIGSFVETKVEGFYHNWYLLLVIEIILAIIFLQSYYRNNNLNVK